MCTVTVIPHDQGFRMMCNRDERDTRPYAIPPARHALGSRVATYATDPQGGGTWIGSNDAGLVMALLNRTGRQSGASGHRLWSRGLIIPALLDFDRLADVIDAAALMDVSFFEPFELLVLRQRDAAVLASDGLRLAARAFTLASPLLLTSSSLGDAVVLEPRRRLFDETVVRAADSWLSGQVRFHDHQWADAPQLSVRMRRPGARTVSRTTIDVRGERIAFGYECLRSPAANGEARVSASRPSFSGVCG